MVFLSVRYLQLMLLLMLSVVLHAQSDNATVQIQARIVDENNNPVPYADIANRRMQLGFSADKEGYFSTTMLRTDSLIILKKGHTATKFMVKDSLPRELYVVKIVLPRVPVELTEVQINAIRTHQQIRMAINELSVKNTDLHPDARPLLNPLSYLYELISKKEKEKRFASQLETEEAKRIVLKDLLRLYNNYNIIELEEDEFDRFITYLNMPYDFLQKTSDYDLAVSIKRMYASYPKDKGSSFRKQIYPPALDDLQRIKEYVPTKR